jgi:alkaline phosphatase D
MPRPLNRRIVVLGGLAAAGAAVLPGGSAGGSTAASTRDAGIRAVRFPFTLGVASGDPTPDGMVLWTRLAPAPLTPDGLGGMPAADLPVEWQVANDEAFTSIAASGTVTARAAEAHSVHVEPVGLAAGREYFYRFRADGHLSPVGRTRTAPAAGTSPGQLRFATASCQHFEEGWYHAHRGIAADRPDLVLFLGDYMYENPSAALETVRGYVLTGESDTLAEYRHRYAQYRTDPDLRAAHAAAPWLVVFDDHELENNWNSTNQSAARRQASFQAFWENMPLRAAQRPTGSSIPLYRRVQWGSLARFHMLDTRQFRTPQATLPTCGTLRDPARTISGAAQEQWLLQGLEQRTATWDLLGQQVFFAQRDGDGARSTCTDHSTDAWDGYAASRDRIATGWVQRGVPNMVVLTGDVHKHWASDLRADYYDGTGPVIGTELVTTSVTSGGRGGGAPPSAGWLANNPHVKYSQDQRGYVRATLTPTQLTAEFMVVTPSVLSTTASVVVDRRFVVQAGRPGLQPA